MSLIFFIERNFTMKNEIKSCHFCFFDRYIFKVSG